MAKNVKSKLEKEIKSLQYVVDDTSGTVPQSIKDQALKTIEKLTTKLHNVSEIIAFAEEITPVEVVNEQSANESVVNDAIEPLETQQIQQVTGDLRGKVLDVLRKTLDETENIKNMMASNTGNGISVQEIESIVEGYVSKRGLDNNLSNSSRFASLTIPQQEKINYYQGLYLANCQSFAIHCHGLKHEFDVKRIPIPGDKSIVICWEFIKGIDDSKNPIVDHIYILVKENGEEITLNFTMGKTQLDNFAKTLVSTLV